MKYRIIQWATGGMGKNCLRAVIDHPAMELVGVYVYSRDKAGKDAGDIARRPATGVIATNDVDEILALDADVVIHAARIAPPYGSHDAEILQLLAAGKNVISINGYSRPEHWRDARLAALEAACRKGGTTLLNAGLNPGFVGEQLAVVATGVCTAIDHIEVVETRRLCAGAQPGLRIQGPRFRCRPEDRQSERSRMGTRGTAERHVHRGAGRHGRASWDDPGSRRNGAPCLCGLEGSARCGRD